MEVKSNVIEFPFRRVTAAEFDNHAQRAPRALTQGQKDAGPLPLFGAHKERISLMRWASGCSLLDALQHAAPAAGYCPWGRVLGRHGPHRRQMLEATGRMEPEACKFPGNHGHVIVVPQAQVRQFFMQ